MLTPSEESPGKKPTTLAIMFVVFEFANVQSVVEQVHPEISGVIKEEDFKLVFENFEYAKINKHDELIIDQTSKHIFKLNWDTALILN